MASTNVVGFISEQVTASVDTAKFSLSPRFTSFIGWLEVSNRVGGTFTVKIQHSADGTNWIDLATFAVLSANGSEAVQITDNVFVNVRANIVAATSPDADVKVQLWYDTNKG